MRGDIWVAQADLYATKVRPILIVQADECDSYESIITCLLTTFESSNSIARIKIEPDKENGLKEVSFVMVDKMFSFDKMDLDKLIGRLSDKDMERVSKKLRSVLGV